MARVPDSTLVWLWDQLQQYSQARVAYNDVAAALVNHPSLQPRTDTYHFENGRSALLVCLSGTIPVDFRGRQYRYPVELWVPQEYGQPGAGIIGYVRPAAGKDNSAGMVVRPGQHVAVDGRIYHPYLRDWGLRSRSTIVDFLNLLQAVFAKEPPIVAVSQPRQPGPPQHSATPPPPPKQHSVGTSRQAQSAGPPPLPSKPGTHDGHQGSPSHTQVSSKDGPPLPPLPPGITSHQCQSSSNYSVDRSAPQPRIATNIAPPLPSKHQGTTFSNGTNGAHSPVSPMSPPAPANRYDKPAPLPQEQIRHSPAVQYQQPPPSHGIHQPQYHPQPQRQPQVTAAPLHHNQSQPQHQRLPPQPYAGGAPQQNSSQSYPGGAPQQQHQQMPPAKAAAAAPDLLTDPFDISLTTPTQSGPAPPIPPNPEKEHLLTLLSQSLTSLATSRITQSRSAIGPLTTQRQALFSAHTALKSELAQLQALDHTLASNERILHASIRDCAALVEASTETPQPNIDEVLVAPTLAAQQLWNLCAEEAAIREALWCLQRAVGEGRVSGTEFVRSTRALAREAFLKMALARKVARGLGLDVKGR